MPITMKKAVEILELNVKEGSKKMPPDVRDALSLAISNMKTTQFIRSGGEWDLKAMFPGEAPEEE